MLEDGAADDRVESLAVQPEAVHQTVQGGGEHVLVRRLCVGAVRAGERNPVAAEDGDLATTLGGHVDLRMLWGTGFVGHWFRGAGRNAAAPSYAPFLLWSKFEAPTT